MLKLLHVSLLCAFINVSAALAGAQHTQPDFVLSEDLDPRFQDFFGRNVVINGDFLFVQAENDENRPALSPGSIQVFHRTEDTWEFVQRLQPFQYSDPISFWVFGTGLAAFGNELVVGGHGATTTSTWGGLFACYERINGRYELRQVVQDGPGYGFGYSLGRFIVMHEGELYVSASGADVPGNARGKILRYVRGANGSDWVFAEEIIPTLVGQIGAVGWGLCFDEGRLIATTSNWAALVFERQNGQWTQIQQFSRHDFRDVYCCTGGGGTLHFGDAERASGLLDGRGKVVEFRWNGSEYVLHRFIYPSDSQPGDEFGWSLARLGDTLVVGARNTTIQGGGEGSAYVFELHNGEWVEVERLDPPNDTVPGSYQAGAAVAIQDDTIVVGADLFDPLGNAGILPGGAFLYERPFGTDICSGVPNSTGQGASLQVRGNRTARAGAVRLESANLPPSAFVLFFAGLNSGFTPMAAGSVGNLCISGAAGRFGASQATPGGSARWSLDFSNVPPTIGGAIQAGDTLVFQAWYRDNGLPPVTNFSQAVSVTFR